MLLKARGKDESCWLDVFNRIYKKEKTKPNNNKKLVKKEMSTYLCMISQLQCQCDSGQNFSHKWLFS